MQNLSFENEFDLLETESVDGIPFYNVREWFRTKTRFDTQAKGNSKMVYCTGTYECLETLRKADD